MGEHSKSTLAQDSRVLTPLLPPLIALVRFRITPSPYPHPLPRQGTFALAGTHTLPLNFYTCEI